MCVCVRVCVWTCVVCAVGSTKFGSFYICIYVFRHVCVCVCVYTGLSNVEILDMFGIEKPVSFQQQATREAEFFEEACRSANQSPASSLLCVCVCVCLCVCVCVCVFVCVCMQRAIPRTDVRVCYCVRHHRPCVMLRKPKLTSSERNKNVFLPLPRNTFLSVGAIASSLSLSVTDLNSCKVIAAWAPDLTPFNVAQVTDPISCKAT